MLWDRCPVCPVCLSVTLMYCGQTVGWIKRPLGTEVGSVQATLCWIEIQLTHGKGHSTPHFSAHVYCDQTAEWIRVPLGTEVGLGPGHIVLDGDQAEAPHGKEHSSPPHFSAHFALARSPTSATDELLFY